MTEGERELPRGGPTLSQTSDDGARTSLSVSSSFPPSLEPPREAFKKKELKKQLFRGVCCKRMAEIVRKEREGDPR